jgi:hypothetical protein
MKTIILTTETQNIEMNLDNDASIDEMLQSFVGALIAMGYQYGSFENYIMEQSENLKEWK